MYWSVLPMYCMTNLTLYNCTLFKALFSISYLLHPLYLLSFSWSGVNWLVPENIRTPTTGGMEILNPHAFGNSKMLYPPRIWNSRLLYPPLSFGIPEVFSTPSEFPIQSTNPPQNIFFRLLKKMWCILNLNS